MQISESLKTYALIKSLYDEGKTYIDCFCPFVLQVMPKNKACNLGAIQRDLKRHFAVEIPIHAITSMLKRLRKTNHIEKVKDKKQYFVTRRGITYIDKLETKRDVDRRIVSFADKIVEYFVAKDIDITQGEALTLFQDFVDDNKQSVLDFINPEVDAKGKTFNMSDAKYDTLFEYMREVEKSRPFEYETMKDLLLGSLISTVVYSRNSKDIDIINKKKFRGFTVYLDTNILFSVLELHTTDHNQAAKELLRILKEFGFAVKVLKSTIDELCTVIKKYRSEIYRYPASVKVDTIYSTLRRKGWHASDVKEFIIEIEENLKKYGIETDLDIDINLDTYELPEEGQADVLSRYKPYQDRRGQVHDLSAIDTIASLRKTPKRNLEDSQYAFVTSDGRLSKYNFIEMGHKRDSTICEVLLDRLLNNILWLKNPELNFSMSAILVTHSRNLFVNRAVWNRFHDVLHGMLERNEITENNVTLLFYHNRIEDVLLDIDVENLSDITPSLILLTIEEQAELLDFEKQDEIQRELKKREIDYLQRLGTHVSETETRRDEEWYEKVKTVNANILKMANKKSKKMCFWMRLAVVAILGAITVYVFVTADIEEFGVFSVLLGLLPLCIAILFGIDIKSISGKCHPWLRNMIYEKRKKEIGFDELYVTVGDKEQSIMAE